MRITADGAVTLANAGHLPPYLNGEEISMAGAFPLGLTPNPEFEALALSVVEEGLVSGTPAASSRTAARLIQTYELQFWNTLAEGLD